MKFEYDGMDDNSRECVAYLDRQGDLCIKVSETHTDCEMVCIEKDGFFHFNLEWEEKFATRKFYHGDKITITF